MIRPIMLPLWRTKAPERRRIPSRLRTRDHTRNMSISLIFWEEGMWRKNKSIEWNETYEKQRNYNFLNKSTSRDFKSWRRQLIGLSCHVPIVTLQSYQPSLPVAGNWSYYFLHPHHRHKDSSIRTQMIKADQTFGRTSTNRIILFTEFS